MARNLNLLTWIPVLAVVALVPPALAQHSISGTVTDNLTNSVPDVEIRLFDGGGTPIGIPLTLTSPLGFYSIPSLPPGDYILEFLPPTAARLVATDQDVTIVASSVVANQTLQPGHLLSGFARDSQGVGIPNIDLEVVDRDTGDQVITPGDDTDATGFYDVIVPTGEFDITWRAVAVGSPPYISVTERVFIGADTVIDVTMFIGYLVSGTVRDSFGNPIVNVNMDFIDSATGVKIDTPGDNTNAAGIFQVQVPTSTYDLRAKPRVEDRLVAGEKFDVSVTSDTTGVDFFLEPGVSLSGVVRNPGGTGVPNVDIDVADGVTGADILTPFDRTDAAGFYQVIIPSGLIEITYEPPVATMLAPLLVAPASAFQDTVVNVTLSNGLLLSGTVRDNLGNPVVGVDLDAKDSVTGLSVPLVGEQTDASGNYATVLAAGTYDLEYEPQTALGLVAELMPGVTISGNTSIDVTLFPGARISGTVVDFHGFPMANVDVDAVTLPSGAEVFTPFDRTNSQGDYEVVIPVGTYRFRYMPDPATGRPDSVVFENEVVNGDRILDVQFPEWFEVGVGDFPFPSSDIFELEQNFPNPFNPSTVIRFSVHHPVPVQLRVYSVAGALVKILRNQHLEPGNYAVEWNGKDQSGLSVASGVYFYRLHVGDFSATRKMILVE